ncbi:MAG: SurA N-terminal domain-containing protein [Alistipes sp.]|nr:SurA N-terminal domain-containing protein [Candidatus Alistipes equi]
MAGLNTLRTKFGVALSIIIGGALLAFVLSLKTEMGFSNNDPTVGVVNGDKIHYSEYLAMYDKMKSQFQGEAYSEEQAVRLQNGTWQSIIAQHLYLPDFSRLGIEVNNDERTAMIRGDRKSNVFSSLFTNAKTGQYDKESAYAFLQQVSSSQQAQLLWEFFSEQAVLDRAINKYMDLAKIGTYVSKLEVDNALATDEYAYTGRYVSRRYSSVPDSVITVTDADKKAYYNEHKQTYKQTPYREISYVEFPIDATQEDKDQLEASARKIAEGLFAAEDVRAYARDNRNVEIAQVFVPSSKLTTDEASAIAADKVYGPALVNNEWKAMRTIAQRRVPQTMKLQNLVLSYTDEKLADSLLLAAKGGADFTEMVKNYSKAQNAEDGGMLEEVTYASLNLEFADALQNVKKNQVVKVVYGNVIQLMKVLELGKVEKHYQVATMSVPVEASQATKRNVHTVASAFAVAAKGSLKNFQDAAKDKALSTRKANVDNGARFIRGIDGNTIELIRWIGDAKVGDVSDIINIDGTYYVAVLTSIVKDEYKSIAEVDAQLRTAVLHDKKYEEIVKTFKGATLEEIAGTFSGKVEEFKDAKYSAYYIPGIGIEPRAIGAMAKAEKGQVIVPIKGNTGVFAIVVDEVKAPEEAKTAEAEKVKLESQARDMAASRVIYSAQQMAEIEDNTAKYF